MNLKSKLSAAKKPRIRDSTAYLRGLPGRTMVTLGEARYAEQHSITKAAESLFLKLGWGRISACHNWHSQLKGLVLGNQRRVIHCLSKKVVKCGT